MSLLADESFPAVSSLSNGAVPVTLLVITADDTIAYSPAPGVAVAP